MAIKMILTLNISLNEIAAFGDDANDIEMLKICGTGIAVSNAIDTVKAVVNHITLSNDEDGVTDWIENNLFRKASASNQKDILSLCNALLSVGNIHVRRGIHEKYEECFYDDIMDYVIEPLKWSYRW